MTVYTALPTDDLNLAVEVTESNDMVTINITPAIVTTGSGSGSVTNVASGTGLLGGPITTSGTLSVDVGTTANKIVQLDATAKLPAVDGSQLTNLPGGGGSGTVTSIIAGTGLSGGTITTTGTIAIDSTVVTLDGTQTLTNKTLTSPVLGGTTTTASGNLIVSPATQIVEVKGNGVDTEGQIKLNCHANTHGQTLKAQPHSATVTNTMLLPTGANSTLVSEIATQTLTNKTLTDPTLEKITTGTGQLIIETEYSNPAYTGYNGTVKFENYANPSSNQINIAGYRTANNHEFFRMGASGSADDGTHNANFQLRGELNSFASNTASNVAAPLLFNASEIKFYNAYTFPTTDGTANQVLTTNGAGALTFATGGGGGGATDLNSLTDVTITSVQNNDLLMYNSTATKWQNTNLGVSVTPTLTGASAFYAGQTYVLTVSNNATYQDPAYFVEVYTGATKVVANSAVTDNGDGTLSFAAPLTGTHEIRVRCQDFGDLQSEIATKALTTTEFSFNYRYFRMRDWTGTATTSVMVGTFAMYDTAGQSGTKYPTNMTSNTAPAPFVASGTGSFSSNYDYYKPFNGISPGASFYWNLSGNNATNYVDIDLGSAVNIKSLQVQSGQAGYLWDGCTIFASDTGVFGGEEVTVAVVTGVVFNVPKNIN